MLLYLSTASFGSDFCAFFTCPYSVFLLFNEKLDTAVKISLMYDICKLENFSDK